MSIRTIATYTALAHKVTIRFDSDCHEYRATLDGDRSSTYFTNDLEDAQYTAGAMLAGACPTPEQVQAVEMFRAQVGQSRNMTMAILRDCWLVANYPAECRAYSHLLQQFRNRHFGSLEAVLALT